MNSITKNQKLITSVLFFAFLTALAASFYIREKQEDYRNAVAVKLAEQETTLVRISSLIGRESVDSVVGQVVTDCELEERIRFDELLGSLSLLNRTELIEIDKLFDACGSYFADRQAILVLRFVREVEIYSEYLSLLELTSEDTRNYADKLQKWSELKDLEAQKSQLSLELVNIQEEIIDLLLAGELISSDSMAEKIAEAQKSKDTLSVVVLQAESLRREVNGL